MGRSIHLDALRGLAVAIVVLYHAHEILGTPWLSSWGWGWVGVDLFFALSGFFMSLSVLRPTTWDARRFLAARIRRIVPAYFACIVLLTAFTHDPFQILVSPTGWWHYLSHILFIHTVDPATRGTINGVFWTLGIEFPFYLLIASLAQLLRKGTWIFFAIMTSWIVIALAWRWGVMVIYDADGPLRWMNSTQLPGTLDAFAAGAIVAWLYHRGHLAALHRAQWIAPLLALAALAAAVWCVCTLNAHAGNYWLEPGMVLGWRFLLALTCSFLLISAVTSDTSATIAKLTTWTGLPALGAISYSVYLYHLPLMLTARSIHVAAGPNALFLITLALIFIISIGSYRLVECAWHTPPGRGRS
jgi:peptidoglycan/LPS O-acetylase OafA/YrhL